VIVTRRLQRSFADGFIFDAVEDLWEPWMRHADKALEDDALLLLIQQELMKRCKKQDARPSGDTGRSRAQDDAVEACPRLELPSADARGTSELGVSPVHPHRWRQRSG
jgi:hypothetical protein